MSHRQATGSWVLIASLSPLVPLCAGAGHEPEDGGHPEDPGGALQAQARAAAEAGALQLPGHRHEAHGRQHGRGTLSRDTAAPPLPRPSPQNNKTSSSPET